MTLFWKVQTVSAAGTCNFQVYCDPDDPETSIGTFAADNSEPISIDRDYWPLNMISIPCMTRGIGLFAGSITEGFFSGCGEVNDFYITSRIALSFFFPPFLSAPMLYISDENAYYPRIQAGIGGEGEDTPVDVISSTDLKSLDKEDGIVEIEDGFKLTINLPSELEKPNVYCAPLFCYFIKGDYTIIPSVTYHVGLEVSAVSYRTN